MELYYMVMNWGSLLMSIFLSQLRLHLTFERMLLSELDKFVKSAFPLTFPPTSGISLMTIWYHDGLCSTRNSQFLADSTPFHSYNFFNETDPWVYRMGIKRWLCFQVKKDLPGKQLKEAPEDGTLPLCWKGTEKFKSILDVKKFFKTLYLVFANGKRAQLEIAPAGYLIITVCTSQVLASINKKEFCI